jgi:serine/threonine protein kinase/tetratricopeptide (TPR) repeat protein
MKCPKCGFENPEGVNFCGGCAAPLSPSVSHRPGSGTKTFMTPVTSLTTGTTFAGRYQVIEELGAGGMGQVLKVLDTEVNEKVALKLLRPEISKDSSTIERFSNELRLARKISHKNVCRLYHFEKEADTYYITMEYVAGEDLKSFIKRSGQLTVGKTVHIGVQICKGLNEAHSTGIIHRDLKPQNIMIDRDGNAKIMDFGIAYSMKAKGITGTRSIIGTPEYMSPEQAEVKKLDQRSDIYSLGVILFEMATGQIPFEGETPLSVAMKHKSELPPEPKMLNSQIPEQLNRVIIKCLEKEKNRRYQTVNELLSDLLSIEKAFPTGIKIRPKKETFTSREITVHFSLRKLFIPALTVLSISVAAVLLWTLFLKQPSLPSPESLPSVAVISFENQTGDTYDYLRKVIPNLLISSLEQSGYLRVTTWERLHDLIRNMGKEDVEFIDQELGFRLCGMEGIDTIVLGLFTKAGDMFATDVKVLDVRTKNLVKSASSKGRGQDSIIAVQIDELSKIISRGIGLSEKKIQAGQKQIADVATASLEAYDNYLKGLEAKDKFYHNDARKFFEKAVELDPEFAIAHYYLNEVNSSLMNYDLALDQLKKAKTLSDKATEKERLYIDAGYALMVENNTDKYHEILHDISKKYPKEKRIWYRLGLHYRGRGNDPQKAVEMFKKALDLDSNHGLALNSLAYTYMYEENYDKAIEYFNKYATVSPGDANPLDSMADLYYKMGRLEESAAKYSEAVGMKPDFRLSLRKGTYVYMILENYPKALDFIQKFIDAAPSPGAKVDGLWIRGFLHFWLGRLEQALSDFRVLLELEDVMDTNSRKSRSFYMKMWIHYERGEYDSGRKAQEDMMPFLKDESGEIPFYWQARRLHFIGLTDLKENNIQSAKSRLEEMERFFPKIQRNKEKVIIRHNLLNAEVKLAEGRFEEAVAFCEKELCLVRTYTNYDFNFNIPIHADNSDILARAYQKAGKVDFAISEYEKLLTLEREDRLDRFPINPRYHYRIARLYEQKG